MKLRLLSSSSFLWMWWLWLLFLQLCVEIVVSDGHFEDTNNNCDPILKQEEICDTCTDIRIVTQKLCVERTKGSYQYCSCIVHTVLPMIATCPVRTNHHGMMTSSLLQDAYSNPYIQFCCRSRTDYNNCQQVVESFPPPSPLPSNPNFSDTKNLQLSDLPSMVPSISQLPSDLPSLTPSSTPSLTPTSSTLPTVSNIPTTSPSTTSAPTGVQPEVIIKQILLDNARLGGTEFEDVNSYQSSAMEWIVSHAEDIINAALSPTPPLIMSTTTVRTSLGVNFANRQVMNPFTGSVWFAIVDHTLQLYALTCLYFNTYSVSSQWTEFLFDRGLITTEELPGWFVELGWLQDPIHYCFWYQMVCNTGGYVTEINLESNGLTGGIPPELTFLSQDLIRFNIFDNFVFNPGDVGNAFWGELTSLQYLYVGNNAFQYDGIPTEIGLLTNLIEYDCSYTLYYGPIHGSTFENLNQLNYLVLDGNNYDGPLPSELYTLPELEHLYVVFANINNDLSFINEMPHIFQLWLDDNPNINTTIPTTIGQVTTLASFSCAGCNLQGTIPTELSQLTDLIQLWLYDNQLTGTIPSELADLIFLQSFYIQNNDLIGTMPSEICSRRDPFGRLDELGADCTGNAGTIDDPTTLECTTTCCSCCGETCSLFI